MILAIDLGTTTCKTIILDENCRIVEKKTLEYAFSSPREGWAEQDPEDWWVAVSHSVRAVMARTSRADISAVGLSGQMHGLVALDGAERVIRPAILWNDQRAESQCRDIYAKAGGRAGLLAHTNNAMLPGYVGGKILWLRENEPENFGRLEKILLPKDYIRYRLTGEFATDVSDASGTGLFDVRSRRWAKGLLDELKIPEELLPRSHDSNEVLGTILPEVADELGLAPSTKVVAGGGDAVMQTVGSGTLGDRDVLAIIGTGGNVTMTVPTCPQAPGPTTQVFCHVVPGKWVSMGVTLNAGNSLKWFRDLFGTVRGASGDGKDAYALLSEEAETSPPGAGGLIFLPYMQGERCPHTDVNARGCFIGMGLNTRRPDFVRSIMEGVVFSLYDAINAIRQDSNGHARLIVSGGGASSTLWLQILADVFDRQVVTKQHGGETSAVGAGIVAGAATGVWGSIEEGANLVNDSASLPPDPARVGRYRELFEVYRSLYPELSRSFDAIAAIR
ncbi:MAG: xylulokinase [Rectinemataceae bacterium]|jgi:xylulokinase